MLTVLMLIVVLQPTHSEAYHVLGNGYENNRPNKDIVMHLSVLKKFLKDGILCKLHRRSIEND